MERPLAAARLLDAQQFREELACRPAGAPDRGGIEVRRLRIGHVDGSGLDRAGELQVAEEGAERCPGVGEMGGAIAEVRADRDRDYSIHRVGSTCPTRGPT